MYWSSEIWSGSLKWSSYVFNFKRLRNDWMTDEPDVEWIRRTPFPHDSEMFVILLTLNPCCQCFGACSSERVVYGKVCHLVPWSYRNQGQRFHHSCIAFFFSSFVFLQLMAPVGGRSSFIRELQPKNKKLLDYFALYSMGGASPTEWEQKCFNPK